MSPHPCSSRPACPARWLHGTITPAADDATLVVVRDVTQQRRLEDVRRDFVANASHELKTPAATIQAVAETLGQAAMDDPEAVPRFASQLEREAVRLSRIVADLLDLSRLESGSSLDELVSLGAAVREEGQRLKETAEHARVTLEIADRGRSGRFADRRGISLFWPATSSTTRSDTAMKGVRWWSRSIRTGRR